VRHVLTRRCPVESLAACAGEDWVDPSRRPFVEGDTAWIPVRDGYEFDEVLPARTRRDGRGYQRLGDLVLFHGPEPDAASIREAVARCSPRGVLWIRGHAGAERLPEVNVIAGEGGETVCREDGLAYRLDPERVMFSQGNRNEKRRLAALVRPGERLGDLFAGIGYFSLPAARAGAHIHAMELNPTAFAFLEKNIALNGLADRVNASYGDCRDLLSGTYDRLVLGHFDSPAFLEVALAHVRAGTVIHLHALERTPGELSPSLDATVTSCGYAIASSVRRVKKYAPGRSHTVHDLVIQ